MNTKAKLVWMAAMVVGLNACANDNGEKAKSVEQNNYESPVAEKEGAAEEKPFAYETLMFKQEGLCGAQAVYFQKVTTEDVLLGKAYDGKDMLANVDIQLYRNHQFELEYEERDIEEYTATGHTYRRTRVRNLSGYWKQDGKKLVLGDLATLEGRIVDGKIKVSVLYLKDMVSVGLAGQVAVGMKVMSSSAIESYREICPEADTAAGEFSEFFARKDRSSIKLKSLQMKNEDAFMSGSNKIAGVELFFHADGNYHLIFRVVDVSAAYPVEKVYLIDDGIWNRRDGKMSTYTGTLVKVGDKVQMRFSKNLVFYWPGEEVTFATRGKTIELGLAESDFDMDDLTSNYKGGQTRRH